MSQSAEGLKGMFIQPKEYREGWTVQKANRPTRQMRRVQQELFGLYLCLLFVLCEISKSQLTTGEGCWGQKEEASQQLIAMMTQSVWSSRTVWTTLASQQSADSPDSCCKGLRWRNARVPTVVLLHQFVLFFYVLWFIFLLFYGTWW